MIAARDISVHFEGVHALEGVSLTLERSDILGVIGPNGAGKTTLVNVLSGYQHPIHGDVELDGARATGWTPAQRARRGIVRTFQSVRPFAGLTVVENVELGALGVGRSKREARAIAVDLLDRFRLADYAAASAAALPAGAERRLGIARALAAQPRFLLLDEPAAGLNEAEGDELLEILVRVHGEMELGILIIEHDMRIIMRFCRAIHVLDFGKTIATGDPASVRSDPAVLAAYLGTAGTEEGSDAAR